MSDRDVSDPAPHYIGPTTGEEIEDPDFFSTWTITHKDQLAV